MLFSRSYAARCLDSVRGRLDARSIELYEGCEYFHDAYIEKIEFSFSRRQSGRTDCHISLYQDVFSGMPKKLTLHMEGVKFFHLDQQKKFNFIGSAIYWLYMSDAGDNVEVRCSTDRLIEFTAVAEKVSIT